MKELTEAGLETLVLERGRMVEHGIDYVTEHKRPWEMPHRGRMHPDVLERDYPVQSRTIGMSAYTEHWFYKDREVPIVEEKPFTWVQTAIVGGRTVL